MLQPNLLYSNRAGAWRSSGAVMVGGAHPTRLVEGGVYAAGVALYLRSTLASDRVGRYGIWALAGFLVLIYASQFSGAVPPDASTVALAGLLQWLFVLLGFWIDRHRKAVPAGTTQTTPR